MGHLWVMANTHVFCRDKEIFMPTVPIRPRKIIVKEGTYPILSLYDRCAVELSPEQKAVLGISLEEIAIQGGLKSAMRASLEWATGDKQGAKQCSFALLECTLSDFAFKVREEYLLFINKLVETAGKNSKEVVGQEAIESRYVLIYEILLRLVTVTLSNEENKKRSGDKLIEVFESFVREVLANDGLGLEQVFRYELSCYQAEWKGQFRQVVEIIQLTHLPENTFTEVANYLVQIKNTIQSYILAQCNLLKSKDDISDQWINSTYIKFMNQGLQQASELHLVDGNKVSLTLNVVQKNKLTTLKNNTQKVRVQELFLLLNQTNLLSDMIGKIASIVEMSGWVLLLMRKLHFSAVVKYIQLHKDRCDQLLDFSKSELNEKSKVCDILMMQGRFSGKEITAVVPKICRKLEQLGSINYHGVIINQFAENVSALLVYEKELGIQLINDASIQASIRIGQESEQRSMIHSDLQHETSDNTSHTRVLSTLSKQQQNSSSVLSSQNIPDRLEKNSNDLKQKASVLSTSLLNHMVIDNYKVEPATRDLPILTMDELIQTITSTGSIYSRPIEEITLDEHPSQDQHYHGYIPEKATENSHLLFVNGNHFERLVPQENKNKYIDSRKSTSKATVDQIAEKNSQSTLLIGRKTMTAQKLEEDVSLSETVDEMLTDSKTSRKENSQNPQLIINTTDRVPWSTGVNIYLQYLQSFFEEYEDVDFKEQFLSLQKNFFEQQTTMGGKHAASSSEELSLDIFSDADNFLHLFKQDAMFRTAAPFCLEVRTILLRFEAKQMDAKKPDSAWLRAFERDVLWECRHIELIYFKYLCVRTAQTTGDERNLKEFVKRFTKKAEEKLGSDYNDLVSDLKGLLGKNLKLRKHLAMNPLEQQAAEIVQLKISNTHLENQVTVLQNEKTALMKQKADIEAEHFALKNERDKIQKNYEMQVKINWDKNGEIERFKKTIMEQNKKISAHDQEFMKQHTEFDIKFENMKKEMQQDIQKQLANMQKNSSTKKRREPSQDNHKERNVSYDPLFLEPRSPRHHRDQPRAARDLYVLSPEEANKMIQKPPVENNNCTLL